MSTVETEINANAFLLNGLAAFVKARPHFEEREINAALEFLYDSGRHLRNVGVAPGNRLEFVYPLEGNESAIGLYYPDNPAQWPAVQHAIDFGSTVLSGPVKLVQGGTGLISRTPVFLDDGSYWGILSLVLDSESLLDASGLNRLTEIDIAIRGKDGLGADGDIFFGSPELFESDPVVVDVHIPGGVWQVAAQPRHGWQIHESWLNFMQAMALIVSAVAIFALTHIRRRGKQFSQMEERLNTILHTSRDSVLIANDQAVIVRANPAAARQFQYGIDELKGQNLDLILPEFQLADMLSAFADSETEFLQQTRVEPDLFNGQSQCGRSFPVEVSLGETFFEDDVHYVLTIRDVSERKEAEQKLRLLANTDFLTGIYNRRMGLSLAEKSLQGARRYQRDLAVMMIDADHFKPINDTWGHDVGDQVLIQMARCIQSVLRSIDIFCWMGGEEFLVVLPETDLAEASQVGERLLDRVRVLEIPAGTGHTVRVTVSIGVSVFNASTETFDSLMREADNALYQAKSAGRDRVVATVGDKPVNRKAV